MSLIAKIQQQSLLQNKLQAQLAEMSYQAVNGTRQSARNFREGTFEIGKMHFNTPQDRITKEMIMDYQQAQQERHYVDDAGNALKYEPTGLKDIPNVEDLLEKYVPIDFKPAGSIPLGGPVDEADLRDYKNQLRGLYNDLEKMKTTKLKQKQQTVINVQKKLLIAKERVQDKIEDMTEVGGQIDIHKNKLQDIQDELDALKASASMTSSPGASTLERQLLKEKSEEEATLVALVRRLKGVLATELVDAENEVIRLDNAVLRFQQDVEDYKTNELANKEKEIEDANLVFTQAQENFKENQDAMQIVKNKNKNIAQQYTDTFNMANRDRYSVQQDPNESDQDYLNRIKQIESQPYDVNIFKEKATNEGNLKLMANLRNSLRDEVKITEIVKSFVPEEVFIINTNWQAIQEQLKIKFGINNPNISVKDYHDEIINVVDTLQNKPFGTVLLPSDTTASGSYSTTTKPTGPATPLLHGDGSASDFAMTVENNSLYIKNIHEQKALWIKIGTKPPSRNHVMFSVNTNNERNFKVFKFTGNDKYAFKKMLEELKLNINTNKDIRDQLFGTSSNKDSIYTFLKNTIKLASVVAKSDIVENNITMYGWGLNKEVITKHAKFGKNIILLDKLYYKNVLSIKDKKMHSIEHLPNVKVSDTLADIIINMCKNERPTKETLDSLNSDERKLFDLLLYVSGLGKSIGKGIDNKKDTIIKELKQRFKITEAEIRAGNNNPVVKSELKEIVNKLILYNVISQNNGKNYLKQF